jgi:hypothetical protein
MPLPENLLKSMGCETRAGAGTAWHLKIAQNPLFLSPSSDMAVARNG